MNCPPRWDTRLPVEGRAEMQSPVANSSVQSIFGCVVRGVILLASGTTILRSFQIFEPGDFRTCNAIQPGMGTAIK